MKISYSSILYNGLIWNKEKVLVRFEDEEGNHKDSEIKRLEFHYDAIDNDYSVDFIEPMYDEDIGEYLRLWCSNE